MQTLKTDIWIDALPEAVWRVLVDYPAYAEWNPYLVRVEGIAQPGTAVTVHACVAAGAEPMVQVVDVVAIDPPRTMRWEGGLPDRSQFKGDHWWALEDEGGGTRLRHFEHFSGVLAGQILALHEDAIRGNFARFNAALKARSEDRA